MIDVRTAGYPANHNFFDAPVCVARYKVEDEKYARARGQNRGKPYLSLWVRGYANTKYGYSVSCQQSDQPDADYVPGFDIGRAGSPLAALNDARRFLYLPSLKDMPAELETQP